ncbi:hypothetical protein [Paracoccus versutus]|uniref:hypothetical protein n=1 Tax=Paracoccus versutus TaxID=34007 RepID=UPI0012EDD190|nr:hypothetical protein [Paracoccus versutus]
MREKIGAPDDAGRRVIHGGRYAEAGVYSAPHRAQDARPGLEVPVPGQPKARAKGCATLPPTEHDRAENVPKRLEPRAGTIAIAGGLSSAFKMVRVEGLENYRERLESMTYKRFCNIVTPLKMG